METNRGTAYQIEIMLHHHCSGARCEREDAPAYAGELKGLIDAGLLDYMDGIPRSTLLGQGLIEMWCATPIPEIRFVDPRSREVDWGPPVGREFGAPALSAIRTDTATE